MSSFSSHRLEGLESDNLLAFLALLGLLRALEIADAQRPPETKLYPRVAWDVDLPPLRPRLYVAGSVDAYEVSELAAREIDALTRAYDFQGRKDLDHSSAECRAILAEEVRVSSAGSRTRADLLAALMTDAARDEKTDKITPTPLCLLFGQGHQHFLERLSRIPKEATPPRRGKGRYAVTVSESDCLHEALFQPWHRQDATSSFRWDPDEDVRYALMAGDPTDPAYQRHTQHGANRLAAVGMSVLTIVPREFGRRVRTSVIGGSSAKAFTFAWPIWREPATLTAIAAMLSHPDLRRPEGLAHLGVEYVLQARRLSAGKFMNFARAVPIPQ